MKFSEDGKKLMEVDYSDLSPDGELSFEKIRSNDISETALCLVKKGVKSIKFGCGTRIKGGLMRKCSTLERVELPKSLSRIDANSFEECPCLKEIVIPDKVKQIGRNAFLKCEALEHVVFGSSVEEIHANAFRNCKSLKTVVLPKTLKMLGDAVFSASGIEGEITIPEGVEEIGHRLFEYTRALKKLTFEGALPRTSASWGYCMLADNGEKYENPILVFKSEEGVFPVNACYGEFKMEICGQTYRIVHMQDSHSISNRFAVDDIIRSGAHTIYIGRMITTQPTKSELDSKILSHKWYFVTKPHLIACNSIKHLFERLAM